jgi:GT2 family glycosyltransferase
MRRQLSVILATWNGAATVREQLDALARQRCHVPWELVVADNGSTDGTQEVVREYLRTVPHLRTVDAGARRGQAAACNIAAQVAEGDALVFCDQDDVVQDGWLAAMAGALAHHHLVAGAIRFLDEAEAGPGRCGPAAPTTAERSRTGYGFFGFLPYGLTANLGVSREAFERVGGFDESLPTEDVDFCWRVQLRGFPLHFEPAAVVFKRRRAGLADAWRQHYRYGLAHPALFRRYRSHGMPRGLGRAIRRWGWLCLHVVDLMDRRRRGTWVRVAAGQVGRLVGSIRARALYL